MKSPRLQRASRALLMAMMMVLGLTGAAGASVMSHASSGPKYGGTVVLSGQYYPLYWLSAGFTAASAGATENQLAMGELILPPYKPGGPYVPSNALSWSFNKASTEFTLQLRPGVKFTDGTPLTAQAVAWNWSSAIGGQAAAATAIYLAPIASITTKGKYTVIVHFSAPDAVFLADIAYEPVGTMESPTAYANEGVTALNNIPVGAGPFKITSDNPDEQIVMKKNPGYWDAKHIYLSEVDFLYTGTDTTATYDDLLSGEIAVDSISGTSTPGLLATAITNHNFNLNNGPAISQYYLPVTQEAPFNNLLAREAVAYCINRQVLATSTFAGFASPSWVTGSPAQAGFPLLPNGKADEAAAQKLEPYQYNPAMSQMIVSQLGGLSFALSDLASGATLAAALQQEWTACGMKVTISTFASGPVEIAAMGAGTYQIFLGNEGGVPNPLLTQFYIDPGARFNLNGEQADPIVTAAWNRAVGDSNPAKLTKDLETMWGQLNKDGDLIPIVSSGSFIFSNKCVHGFEYNYPTNPIHAWLACSL